MTRKRKAPPWIRARNRHRAAAALGVFAGLVIVATIAFFAQRHPVATQVFGAATTAVRLTSPPPAASTASARPSSSSDMPDSTLTPGEAVTTDATLVCRPGYATSIRPEGQLWRHLKDEAYDRYGLPRDHRSVVDQNGARQAAYEVDHLVPLELGGDPTDIRNIWPQPIVAAKKKDEVENQLHDFVCSGRMSITQAQAAIARDWKTAVSAGTSH